MRISVAKEDGGYIKNNGEIQVIFIDGDWKHGEQCVCDDTTPGHTHSKACAQRMLDVKPVVTPAVPEDTETDPPTPAKPAVLGPSMKERGVNWLAERAAEAAKPAVVPVVIEQKTIRVKGDDGKLKDKSVDDGDLS